MGGPFNKIDKAFRADKNQNQEVSFGSSTNSKMVFKYLLFQKSPGLEVIKLKYSLRLKIQRNDWLLADTCPQAVNHCAVF